MIRYTVPRSAGAVLLTQAAHASYLVRGDAVAQGQYIRVYHVLREEHPGVWRSDAQLALFVRLLAVADKWWPQLAPVAHRNGAYQSLVKAGLVLEKEGTDGYTIKGLDKERSRRSEHGRHAASIRHAYSEHAASMPSKAEQNKAEQTNGQSPPQSFMGWKQKQYERLPGEAANPVHDGRHPVTCTVCHPLPRAGVDA